MPPRKFFSGDATISREFSSLIEGMLRKSEFKTQEEEDLKNYVRLVLSIAKSYIRTRVEYEDLVMCGIIGLINARRNFNPDRSKNFKSYATMRIVGEIYSYCQANCRLVTVPTHISKASSYVEKMVRTARLFHKNEMSQEDIDSLVEEYDSEFERTLPESAREKIRYFKDRLASIAKNSCLEYSALAIMAKNSLVSTVSDSVLMSTDFPASNVENKVSELEIQQSLLDSLGPKRFMILKLHYQGYTNPEISNILFESGYCNYKGKPISRAAIKNLLDNALHSVKTMSIFSKDKEERRFNADARTFSRDTSKPF